MLSFVLNNVHIADVLLTCCSITFVPQELLEDAKGCAELEKWPQYKGHLSLDAMGKAQACGIH